MDLTHTDRKTIRELSKTIYDPLVAPPSIDSLTHLVKFQPKNYSTVSLEELGDFVIENFSKHEPLISKLSNKNKEQLLRSIRRSFGDINFMDLESGGDGLINPTFIEIMTKYILRIRDKDCSELVNDDDKKFYHKYFWCFDQHARLTYNQMNKKAS